MSSIKQTTKGSDQNVLPQNGINWIGLGVFIRREFERTMRVAVQTILSPIISATLYIFVFGFVIGTSIDMVAGVEYITFVFPGILLLNIVRAAFASGSTILYILRWTKGIEEILISPFSYVEMIIGFVLNGIIRATIIAVLTIGVGLLFGAVTLVDPVMFFVYVILVATIFSLIGMIVALWADSFEQLSVLDVFVIAPLTYLGGIFYSIAMLPSSAQFVTQLNPLFYFVDGVRASMIGISEANSAIGLGLIVGLAVVLFAVVVYLFKIGWRIRA